MTLAEKTLHVDCVVETFAIEGIFVFDHSAVLMFPHASLTTSLTLLLFNMFALKEDVVLHTVSFVFLTQP